jgi:predicted CoA-binding protein
MQRVYNPSGMNPADFINFSYHYAVVGATTNKEKYGYRVLLYLHKRGFRVVGVNPKYKEVASIACYPTIAALPDKPDVLVLVLPPVVGVKIIKEAQQAGIKKIWFQPGAESVEAQKLSKQFDININDPGSCIMIEHQALKILGREVRVDNQTFIL